MLQTQQYIIIITLHSFMLLKEAERKESKYISTVCHFSFPIYHFSVLFTFSYGLPLELDSTEVLVNLRVSSFTLNDVRSLGKILSTTVCDKVSVLTDQ